jgi:hypothetical protein
VKIKNAKRSFAMSLLSKVTSGRVFKPYLVTIFGPEGTWKSTFGSEAPDPLFAPTEDGSDQLNVRRLPRIQSYPQIMEAIGELLETKHDFKTFVVDSLDHLEPLIWDHVAKVNNWKNIEEPGYGKGYVAATECWGQFFSALKKLRDKMNVILIAHSQVKNFNDPALPAPYDRYEIKLHKGASALVKENCDAVLYSTYKTVVNIDKATKRGKGFGGDECVIFTQYRAHHDGKNRFGLPYELPCSFKAFDEAVKSAAVTLSPETLVEEINGMLAKCQNEEIKQRATTSMNAAKEAGDTKKLAAIKKHLAEMIQE